MFGWQRSEEGRYRRKKLGRVDAGKSILDICAKVRYAADAQKPSYVAESPQRTVPKK